MAERWKAIPNHDGYEASSLGRIRSVSGKRLVRKKNGRTFLRHIRGRLIKFENSVCGSGYYSISLGPFKSRMVHRLIAETFIEKPDEPSRFIVDHINGNKTDNRVENLRWVSYKENTAASRMRGARGKKFNVFDIESFLIDLKKFPFDSFFAQRIGQEKYGMERHTVAKIISYQDWATEDFPHIKKLRDELGKYRVRRGGYKNHFIKRNPKFASFDFSKI